MGGREGGCVGAGIWGFSRSLSGLGEGELAREPVIYYMGLESDI